MYWKMAVSARRRVSQVRRQISSALMVLKKARRRGCHSNRLCRSSTPLGRVRARSSVTIRRRPWSGGFCFEDAGRKFRGNSSGSRETFKAGILARISASQACGSISLIFAVTIREYMKAVRSPPRSEPAKSSALGPRAVPRKDRSAALLVRQARPSVKLLDPSLLSAGRPWPFAAITLDLTGPNAKAVGRTTQFARDRRQRRSFALIFIAVFHKQPDRTLAELR